MAQTGLALLALQASGNYESNQEKYSSQVRLGLKWLIDHQGPEGALVGSSAAGSRIIRIHTCTNMQWLRSRWPRRVPSGRHRG